MPDMRTEGKMDEKNSKYISTTERLSNSKKDIEDPIQEGSKIINLRVPGSIPGLGRSPREGKGYPLQYSAWRIPWII